MNIAYLVLAHDCPSHLSRVINALKGDGAHFFIHIDKKADIEGFRLAGDLTVSLIDERFNCAWGDISLVDATLALARAAVCSGSRFDYFVLLSGACYPVQPKIYIEDFFRKNKGTEFIEVFDFPNPEYGKSVSRLTKYWFRKDGLFRAVKWRIQHLLNKLLPDRNYCEGLKGLEAKAGSQWWALTLEAVSHVLEFIEENPDFYNFCKHIDCPDEIVIQTILANSRFVNQIGHSLTYTRWTPGKTGPDIIDASCLGDLGAAVVIDSEFNNCPHEKEEVLFARKFSCANQNVVDMIDGLIESKQRGSAVASLDGGGASS